MSFTFSVYYTPLIIAVALSLLTSFYSWQYCSRPEGKALLVLSLSIVWWATLNIFEYGFGDLAVKSIFVKLEYLGIEVAPVAWMIFVAIYTDQGKWLNRRNLFLLAIIPAITVIMIFTNEYHGLMRYNVALDTSGSFSVITKTYGVWFWVSVIYHDIIMVTGVVFIIRRLTRRPHLGSRQLIILLAIGIFPWLGNILYIFKLFSWARIDWTTAFLALSGVVMTFGVARYHLLSVIPIAREFVLEKIVDAILVVDGLNRVVDYNESCRALFGLSEEVAVVRLDRILKPEHRHLCKFGDEDTYSQEIVLGDDRDPQTYELRVDKLYNYRQKFRGRIFYFHDITDRKLAEREREKIIARLQDALDKVKTLSGFLPICSNCKKIRDDEGYWNEVELYISKHSNIQFSHGLCAECMKKLHPEEYKRLKEKGKVS
ncbi:MAG: histidine kinase N-terminal 7TM domain-containing protein [Fidelibacterota bacterium]